MKKKKEIKRRINETFVFKRERQDVGAIVISLNSSIHPRVLTCNFCATECEIKERSLVDEHFIEQSVSDHM